MQNIKTDPILKLIDEYKECVRENGLINEIFKWKLLGKYKGRPDINAPDFYTEISSVDYSNLIYGIGKGAIKHMAKDREMPYKDCLKVLFDETMPLINRLNYFNESTLRIYRELVPDPNRSHHQDERTMATLLTFFNPDKYTFYKDSFYRKYCNLLGISTKKKGEKYLHYLELIDQLINNYINKDKELLDLVEHIIPSDAFQDNNHKILAQDIIYSQLDKGNEENDNENGTVLSDDLDDENDSLLKKHVMSQPLNQILYGPPGTGKTYNTINKALEIIGEKIEEKSRQEVKALFDAKMKEGQIVFTTFHQSMSYEDFIEGIKPVINDDIADSLSYEITPGIFKQFCLEAQTLSNTNFEETYQKLLDELNKLPEGEYLSLKTMTGKLFRINANSRDNLNLYTGRDFKKAGSLTKVGIKKQLNGDQYYKWWLGYYHGVIDYLADKYGYKNQSIGRNLNNYVLIIDEINRGNVSQIFGELITLIEEDKRLGKEEALEVTLPYSKETFGVPPNLYIIGTMNTADRSVEALDAALRRRFSFQEMLPDPELIAMQGDLKNKNGFLGNHDLPVILSTINQRIEKLLDKDHQIGHSYFMKITTLVELKTVFQNKIIPLLQEYFFGDYGKIGLVLGKGFFEAEEISKTNIFADFGDYDAADFSERTIYKMKDVTRFTDDEFDAAIYTLLKK
jgi:hypothetical protein